LVDRDTPHPSTGMTPAELLFGRPTRTNIPSLQEITNSNLDDDIRDNDKLYKEKGAEYGDKRRNAKSQNIIIGDIVIAKNVKNIIKLRS
jgi:hypothetical protein